MNIPGHEASGGKTCPFCSARDAAHCENIDEDEDWFCAWEESALQTGYETCPSCGGSGLQSNTFNGEPEHCRECGGDTVVRARDEKGRFVGGSKPK